VLRKAQIDDGQASNINQSFYGDAHLLVELRDQVVIQDGGILTLTRTEYRLLALLVENAGEVGPRPILLLLTPTDAHFWRLRRN
jgi:DNA-binding response OmpR family regulator